MTKAKRVLALVLAVIMIVTVFTSQGFARLAAEDYTTYGEDPTRYFNSVQKYEFTAEEGATWLLDMLDGLLYDAAIKFEHEQVADEKVAGFITIKAYLTAYITSVDELLWTLYNAITGLNEPVGDNLAKILDAQVAGTNVSGLYENVANASDKGDVGSITVTALGPQNSASRICRGVPADGGCGGKAPTSNPNSDMQVLSILLQFLSDNRGIFEKLGLGTLNLKIALKINIIGLKPTLYTLDVPSMLPDKILPLFTDPPTFIKNLLYPMLLNKDADTAPSGKTFDGMVQDLVNMALVTGTGESPEDGGRSILGANFDAFLPAIGNYPGGASLTDISITADRDDGRGPQSYTMNFYQLVNNALNALLSGFLKDKLYDLLIDLLDIDDSDGMGDPNMMTDMMFGLVTGAIESLCTQNGAPAINWEEEPGSTSYPVPKIKKLLKWFFEEGGLATFVQVKYTGIHITDNFVQLLRDVLRLLPSLVPALGIEYPDGLIHPLEELTAKKTIDLNINGEDVADVPIYTTFEGEEIYYPDPDDKTYCEYLSDFTAVNISNSSDPTTYRNPTFIREAYIVPEAAVWADILKVVLNMFIDGCYFPEWADTIPEVGAYALASLAAKYLPQNNYFDRLDAYHYINELHETYQPLGTNENITPLAYTEPFTITKGSYSQEVLFPRAAADIGASLGAFFLNGAFGFGDVLGFWPETDTNFETYLAEFVFWGAKKYMPLFTGVFNGTQFADLTTASGASVAGTWQARFNQFLTQFASAHTFQNKGTYNKCTNTPEAMRAIIYPLIDDTLFQLIPMSWLPQWVGNGGSSAIFNYWLADSLCGRTMPGINLQQIIELLSINPTGELAVNSPIKVIINLLDRILGTLLGGNAVLPGGLSETIANNRKVFTTATSLTTLESFLGSKATLGSFLRYFVYYLNVYGKPLLSTALPIIMQLVLDPVKKAEYRDLNEATTHDYLSDAGLKNNNGTYAVTLQDLQDYIDSYELDINTVVFSGDVGYDSSTKAKAIANDIGLDDFSHSDFNGSTTTYYVTFPETYGKLSDANKAAEHASAYLKSLVDTGDLTVKGTECYVSSKRVNGRTIYSVLQKLDYKTNTATLTEIPDIRDGNVYQTEYQYTNFRKASTTTRDANNMGKVTYGDGYILYAREDYTTNKIAYLNRRNNAIEDAQEFIDGYKAAVDELGSAYADWFMYYIRLQLRNKNLYDANGDGTIVTDSEAENYDGFPSQPDKKTAYPFFGTSTVTDKDYLKNDTLQTSYGNPNNANGSIFVKYAMEYANEVTIDEETGEEGNHNVAFSAPDTEQIVRLALNTANFDCTKDPNGNYASGAKTFATLTNDEKNTIKTKCQAWGLIYDMDETIERKAFALFTTSNFGSSGIGTAANIGVFEDGSSYSYIPSQTRATGTVIKEDQKLTDFQKARNDQHESYIEFYTKIKDLDDGVAKHFDNISWRADGAEQQMSSAYNYNSLDWAINYTSGAYYPVSQSLGRNKAYNEVTGLLESAYSKASFTEFQKAYDYAVSLKAYMTGGGTNGSQSLISEAYQNVITTYNRLTKFTGAADWTRLESFMAMAQEILDSEIGLDSSNHAKNTDNGYTEETLLNLLAELQVSQDLYNNFYTSYDSDYQNYVDEQTDNLENVINALQFYPGTKPDLLMSTDYTGNIEKVPFEIPGDIRTLGLLIGFEEGAGLTEDYKSNGTFVPTGYTLNESLGNYVDYQYSGRGFGTGSELIGKIGNGIRIEYYCVIKGDVNGDTRIDGLDKAFIDSILAQGQAYENELPVFTKAAADADGNGEINGNDISKVKAHYSYQNVNNIDGTIDQSAPINSSWLTPVNNQQEDE